MSPTVAFVDVIADPPLGQTVSAADGSVVSSVETLTVSGLTAAQLLAADVPWTKRVFTRGPLRPFGPDPVHCGHTEEEGIRDEPGYKDAREILVDVFYITTSVESLGPHVPGGSTHARVLMSPGCPDTFSASWS